LRCITYFRSTSSRHFVFFWRTVRNCKYIRNCLKKDDCRQSSFFRQFLTRHRGAYAWPKGLEWATYHQVSERVRGWPGDDRAVRHCRRLCYLTRLAMTSTSRSVATIFPLLGQAGYSEWKLIVSFPGFSSLPLIFCPFRSPSLCFCHLSRAEHPVLCGFRLPD
jgi:hypothetical protein